MNSRKRIYLLVFAFLALATLSVFAQDEEAPSLVIDDFEVAELFVGVDSFNNAIGHATWGNTQGNVQLSITQLERDGASSSVLAIDYDISEWGGFTNVLTDGENWISQDWTSFTAIEFWLYGNNTGGIVQFEIFDNRNPELSGDSAERWFYRITDDYEGWQKFTIAFDSFQRRTDFQPGGAPNDGLNLNAVSGYAIGFPAGTGATTAYLDDVRLITLSVEPILVDDFEADALFLAQDSFGNNIGYVPWGDTGGNVELNIIEAARSGETSNALNAVYDISSWGGFTHVFNDGTNWTTQDWSQYNAISFWFLGSNTGGTVQFEIFDNRNPDLDGDSAERWYFQFVDDTFSWKQVEIPFADFQRRSDWQPDGAPDDGFNLNAVSGYAFGLPAGTGRKIAIIDDVRVIVIPGLELPAVSNEAEAESEAPALPVAQPAEVVLNEALLAPIPFAEPVMISDFEEMISYVTAEGMPAVGYVPWGDSLGNAVLGITQVLPTTTLALPDATEVNHVLSVNYNISAWGGFNHAFTDGVNWTSQDWTGHNALQFMLYGNNTGQIVQVEIFDNRAPDNNADTAERFFYQIVDSYEGWQQFTIPFAYFQRRTDWQPGGALNDGLTLTAVAGYSMGFPAGVGAQTAYVDNVQIVVVEDPSQVQVLSLAPEAPEPYIVDESIGWDTREWELLWSDEFDAAAGTPINTEFWTCQTGGDGWGNNELEYYTDRLENVAHDGNGSLVITARQETLENTTCHYGECQYTSARCITQDKVEFTYGRVEARIDIPNGQGIWPAFWMLGADFPEIGWPNSGEIDILENIGEPNIVYGTIHGPDYSGGQGLGNAFRADVDLSADYHVYAIDWDENVIRWYVDGELVNLISVNALAGKRWVFDHDFFILMNLAVGGNWPGYPDETTTFPQEMRVDYVRLYQLAD